MPKDDESLRTDNNSGHEAGDRAEVNRILNTPDGDSNPGEAQNDVGGDRLSGKEAEAARNKATEGIRQGRDD